MKNKNELPIGVFDSGMGGLTTLKTLKTMFKYESFLYLCDTARVPYGTRSLNIVRKYTLQMINILMKRKIKALVIACNTATVSILPLLVKKKINNIPIIGIVKPNIMSTISTTKNRKIVIFATETTIISGIYQHYINHYLPNSNVLYKSCNILVSLAEEGIINHIISKETLKYYINGITQEDTLLLGCTHFSIFIPMLKILLPKNIYIVDPSIETTKVLYKVLKENNLLLSYSNKQNIYYLATDSIERFRKIGKIFLNETLDQKDIELVTI